MVRFGARRVVDLVLRRSRSAERVVGLTLTELFEKLGPAFVKVGQILSTRSDLLGSEATVQLARLVDDLPPAPIDTLRAQFKAEFGASLDEVFAEFETEPVASASIACVHRARLPDGRPAAVKLLRPGVADEIALDLRILRRAARVLGRIPPLQSVPVAEAVAELSECVLRQVDFEREAAAGDRLREALQWEPEVVIPEYVPELCGRTVLTMEFIEGLQAGRRGDTSLNSLLAALNALYRMIFVEGVVHCDLHGGNLHFLPGGRVAIIDFGFVADMPDQARLRFAEFFYALASGDSQQAADITLEMAAAIPARLDRQAFTADVASVVEDASGRRARDFLVTDFAGRMFDVQRRHGVHGTTAFVMAIVSLIVFEGMVREMAPDLDFQERAKPFILRSSIRRYDREDNAPDNETSPLH